MKSEGGFSAREARALLWLLPVLAVVSWLAWEVSRVQDRRVEEPPGQVSPDIPSQEGNRLTQNQLPQTIDGESRRDFPTQEERQPQADGAVFPDKESLPTRLFDFDPNTIEYHDLVRLGFTRGEALGIIKYRERGKIFEIPEDFAACYQVSEAMYRRLEPHIRIGERFRLKSWAEQRTTPVLSATPPREGNRLTQAPLPQTTDGESRRDPPPTEWWQAKPDGVVLTDINTADSAALVAVSGIGPLTAQRIIEYRARLGGFAAVEQLAEIRGMTEQNYERIIRQIFADPAQIQKIDINFDPAKSLAGHPYIRAEALRKLLKQRQLKGGWRTAGELESDHIFSREELEKLGPYLVFN
jgi:competence ComEA-like helix-hairpin-helix protein